MVQVKASNSRLRAQGATSGDITVALERWLRAPDNAYDPLNTKDVDGTIRDYLAVEAITSMQGRHLRSVWSNLQEAGHGV